MKRVRQMMFLAVAPLLANDTLATLGAGGLIPLKSSEIVMDREELQISIHQITVRYVFRNQTDKDVETLVAFPLPELAGGLVEHEPLELPARAKANFVDFAVTIAGKPVSAKMEVRAFHEGREITDRLRAAGLPVLVTDPGFRAAVRKLPAQQRSQFVKDELLVSDDPAAANRQYWANWNSKVQFYWTQRFPARGSVEVQHSYRPVVGGAYLVASDKGDSLIKPYCGTAATLEEIQAAKKRHPIKSEDDIVLREKRIRYILTTANNWSGPIRDFRVSVLADSPDDIVLTCLSGLKRSGPARYELVRANFRPDRELELMILHAGR